MLLYVYDVTNKNKNTYPVSVWKTIAGKDYCFGKDVYLFVECYIKSEVNDTYYWVDDDGIWLDQYNTTVPDPGYRVVYNYKTENAYQGCFSAAAGKARHLTIDM